MNAQLEMLIRMQGLDQEAARLRQKVAEIEPQIEASRVHLRAAERDLEEGKAKVENAKKERRGAERDLDAHIEKRRKFSEQQGKVKTNKEYQALMGEMETLKREETAIEDRILALMESVSAVEQRLPAFTVEVAREKTEFQAKEKQLREVEAGLRAELAAVEAQRDKVVAGLEPESLATYQRVQKLRGTALAEARDELCLGCRMTIPPQRYAEAMRNDGLHGCPHCHRLLYYKKPEGVVGAGA
jgi:predicted  nucleic acid-binding Zn-ribbon protein